MHSCNIHKEMETSLEKYASKIIKVVEGRKAAHNLIEDFVEKKKVALQEDMAGNIMHMSLFDQDFSDMLDLHDILGQTGYVIP